MKDALNRLDQLSRRQFVARAAKTALGVSILPIGAAKPLRAAGGGKAEHVIFFYMSGGMTHMETFDPKPGTETGGATKGIDTGVAGVQLAEFMPELAKRFKDIAVIRSMTQKTGDHRGGAYWMRTSYEPRATIIHPSMGPWAQTLLGKKHDTLPDSVVIGGGGEHPGAGFIQVSIERQCRHRAAGFERAAGNRRVGQHGDLVARHVDSRHAIARQSIERRIASEQ